MSDFFKFTSTYHLFDCGGTVTRTDKVFSPDQGKKFYNEPVVIEEKVDGANIGFSLSKEGDILVQNRGNYITSSSHPQFKLLDRWLRQHEDALFELLIKGYILFGEWCYAKHTIRYDRLPDWFLAFDIWDIHQRKFLSRQRRHQLLEPLHIAEVHMIGEFAVTRPKLEHMLLHTQSQYHDGPIEGLYMRLDGPEGYLIDRAKIVRPGFIQSIEEHWTKQTLVRNSLAIEDDHASDSGTLPG